MMTGKRSVLLLVFTFLLCALPGAGASAQTPPVTAAPSATAATAPVAPVAAPASVPASTAVPKTSAIPETRKVTPEMMQTGLTVEQINTLFTDSFIITPLEVALIQKAILGRASNSEKLSLDKKPPPPRRVIQLSGVLWRSNDDWVVWMNGKKVTPMRLLPEIIDIKVENSSSVRLKWFDAILNAVISITLRPHQTYDIGTGILLPG